jgi:hypothetical protein
MNHFWQKIRHTRDSLRVSVFLFFGIVLASFFVFSYVFLPLENVFSSTPPFSMYPTYPLNLTIPRYQAAFFYGTVADPEGTIPDDYVINDSLKIRNLDDSRSITVSLAGKIQNKEGWFVFSENPVLLSPGEEKQISFIINIPYGVCSKLWQAYVIASLSSYDGMPVASGMGVSSSTAIEVFFNIDGPGIPACSGGEILPNLGGVPPAYVPLPTFKGTVPVMSGGGGGTTPPTPVESICNDGIDNDGDGLIDCDDPDCAGRSYCQILPEICNDGIDNDKNGLIDCADPACFGNSYCDSLPEEVCDNGIDDDKDGLIDCDDPDCAEFPACLEVPVEICDDLIDNDGDGLIDCDDPDCAEFPACLEVPVEICDDLIDNDGDGLIDCDDPDCAEFPACLEVPVEICDDLIDNDGDGLIDCDDPDCAEFLDCIVLLPEICDDLIDNDGDGLIDCDDPDCAEFLDCLEERKFTVFASPEKRVAREGGNLSTMGTLKLLGIGGANYSLAVNTDNAGMGEIINPEIPSGWYTISFKGLSHLTKYLKNSDLSKRSIQILDDTNYEFDFRIFDPLFLLAGDTALGKDDFVNSMDISASVRVLYQNEEHSDLNKDGAVNALDLSVLFQNLYKSGEK